MLHELRQILRVTGSGGRYALLILLRAPINVLMTLVNAVFLQQALNAVAQGNGSLLNLVCAIFMLASLATFAYNGTVWSAYAAPFSTRMEGRLRLKLFGKIASLPCERVEALPQGEWLTRLNLDVQSSLSVAWPHAASAVLNIAVSVLILWRMNPAVLGWVLLFVAPHLVFSQLVISRAMPSLQKQALEATAKNTDELTALIACADLSALYEGTDFLMKRFEKSSLDLLRAKMKLRVRNALSAGILPLFGLGGYLTLLVVAAGWIADGRLSFGDLTAAFQYRGGFLVGSLTLINCLIAIQGNLAGIRRLNETMQEPSEEGLHG